MQIFRCTIAGRKTIVRISVASQASKLKIGRHKAGRGARSWTPAAAALLGTAAVCDSSTHLPQDQSCCVKCDGTNAFSRTKRCPAAGGRSALPQDDEKAGDALYHHINFPTHKQPRHGHGRRILPALGGAGGRRRLAPGGALRGRLLVALATSRLAMSFEGVIRNFPWVSK